MRKIGDLVMVKYIFVSCDSTEKLIPAFRRGIIKNIFTGARNCYMLYTVTNQPLGWTNDECIDDEGGGKVNAFCNALTELGDGRYHYWNGQTGIGCSDYVRKCLGEAGIISEAEAADSTSLWAAQGYRRVLEDATRFEKLPAITTPQRGDILWYHLAHVAVSAGGYDRWEAAPESTHGICSNGKTGVGLWLNHNYNCAGRPLTCIYRIIE